MSNDKNGALADESANSEGSNRGGMDGSNRLMMDNSSRREGGEPKRRSSKIMLEGVEYDLSNLVLDDEEEDIENENNINNTIIAAEEQEQEDDNASASSSSASDDSTSGYLSCRSKTSRGTMSRNVSNASTFYERTVDVFDKQAAAARRQSPYRFDVDAMRTLMTSFKGIPELQNSFRLSKSGAIVDVDDETNSERPSISAHDDELLYLANDDDDDANDEEPKNAAATSISAEASATPETDATKPTNISSNDKTTEAAAAADDTDVPGRCSVSTTSTSQGSCGDSYSNNSAHNTPAAPPAVPEDEPIQSNQHQNCTNAEEEEEGIDDLVYDEATGTYVYREYEYTYPDNTTTTTTDITNDTNPPQEYYDDPCETSTEHHNRYTLEEMTADAALGSDDGAYDDEEHEMEISPGIYVPFRGAKETWQAVATHTTHELDCFDCGLALVCINDCEFTVCPDCRVVNPVFCEDPIGKPFGVGMGFKKDWVVKKQHLRRMERERMAQEQRAHPPVRMQSKRKVTTVGQPKAC
ncbi:expressed unknown protein [Seminavis robusta]|uniref:Uncharacterized protein n=1 Tax=Seminavis robusta TaxID=568900 RepID=A0A9N8EN15_9STRA|nr:expressed unknown protein [Seminavis robusta]|eukprot:Sro1255_g256520.1 n/a (526) ;mRNA; f:25813-27390